MAFDGLGVLPAFSRIELSRASLKRTSPPIPPVVVPPLHKVDSDGTLLGLSCKIKFGSFIIPHPTTIESILDVHRKMPSMEIRRRRGGRVIEFYRPWRLAIPVR